MELGRLVGRDAEVAAIAEAVSRAAAGTPMLVLVEGEPGGGKSALLEALDGSDVLPRGRIRSVLLPLEPGDDAVRLAAERLTSHAVFEKLGGRRRTLAAVRKVLPDWIGAIPGWGDLLEAITTTAAALRRRRAGDTKKPRADLPEETEALLGAARRRATALLIDDADRLDAVAADRVFRMLEAAETGTRLLVIAAYRPSAPGAAPVPLVRACDRLPAQQRMRLALRSLDRDAVRAWLEVRLGGSVSDSLLDDIEEATGGLPRAIDTRIEQLQRLDALRRDEEGWHIVARAGIEDMDAGDDETEVDLGPLGPEVRDALSAGAFLGDTFDGLAVARLLERDELWVEDRLAAATRLGVLHLADDAHEVAGELTSLYRFASAAVRAALRRGIAAPQRSLWESRRDGA